MDEKDVEFIIQKTEYENGTFRLAKDLIARIQKMAQQEGISMNEYFIQSAEFSLKHYNPVKKEDGKL